MNSSTGVNSRQTGSRIPPHSHDAEQAVLGAMLIDQSAIAKAVEILVGSTKFYTVSHGKIFEAPERKVFEQGASRSNDFFNQRSEGIFTLGINDPMRLGSIVEKK